MIPIIDRFIDKLIQESTPERPIWNIESIKSGKTAHWNYIDGCMMTSLIELYKVKKDQRYIDFSKNLLIISSYLMGPSKVIKSKIIMSTIFVKGASYLICIR
jgi:rhamnogalacturonyl hydrolase YesR